MSALHRKADSIPHGYPGPFLAISGSSRLRHYSTIPTEFLPIAMPAVGAVRCIKNGRANPRYRELSRRHYASSVRSMNQ